MNDNYYLLDDMEKYDKTFNRKRYESMSIKEIEPIFRDYYNKHLPIDVTTWIRVNEPDDNLIYKKGQGNQVCFLRDTIMRGMFYKLAYGEYKDGEYEKYKNFQPQVISTHKSKSVLLPVMEIELPSYGIKMTFRNNFYDWNISVESDREITFDHKGLINDNTHCYCEGFSEEKIFNKYSDDKKKFTISVDDDYKLYALMFLLKDWLIKVNEK